MFRHTVPRRQPAPAASLLGLPRSFLPAMAKRPHVILDGADSRATKRSRAGTTAAPAPWIRDYELPLLPQFAEEDWVVQDVYTDPTGIQWQFWHHQADARAGGVSAEQGWGKDRRGA